MVTGLKSVVLRTPALSETKQFFEQSLGFRITEYSHQHFVLHSKEIRIVFMRSESHLEVEMYIDTKGEQPVYLQDPNGIKVVDV